MIAIALLFLLLSAGPALAQADCPVCLQATTLRDALRSIEIGNAGQTAKGEALGKDALALVTAFRDAPPPARQGRKAFDALVALGQYAAPLSSTGDYEKALAAIALKDPEYRKRYQALVRKGVRGRDRGASCRMRYLQTNVSVAECKLQAAKGTGADAANRLCYTDYDLRQCLSKKR